MSIEILPTAKEPKRERGKQRVAALIDAGAELFAEKGYEATTMTEIAQRAGAAIGSLYQFFPSKEALAEALFNRYAERAAASFARVEELAPGRTARELADLLIDYKLALRTDRDATIALSSSVAGIVERRKPLADAVRGRIASILRAGNRALSEDDASAAASSSRKSRLAARRIDAMRPRSASPSGFRRSTMPATELESAMVASRSVLSASL